MYLLHIVPCKSARDISREMFICVKAGLSENAALKYLE